MLAKKASDITVGEHQGATVVVEGRGLTVNGYQDGYWVGPSLLDHVSAEMSV